MACLNPISKMVKTNPFRPVYSTLVPCGKCINCIKKKQQDWILRLIQEAKCHSVMLFVTLTYREEYSDNSSVPCFVDNQTGEVFRSVYKPHLQYWIKRFRINRFRQNKSTDFKYFFTSEYGPRTKRPHYHGLIFGISKRDFSPAEQDWQFKFGFTVVKEIPLISDKQIYGACKYVSKYALKGEFENPLIVQKKVLPNFRLISKGLGINYVRESFAYHRGFQLYNNVGRISQIFNKSRMYFNGFYYSMPRYYKEKIFGNQSYLSAKLANHLLQVNDELYRAKLTELQLQNSWSELEAFRFISMQETADNTQTANNNFTSIANFFNYSKL